MSDTTKVSFSLDDALLREVIRMMDRTPKQNQTQVLNQLIERGVHAEQELLQLRQREEYVLLKTLHMMRVLASSRGEGFLQEVDAQFDSEMANMKEMIYQHGIDYVNG